ncbi:hypothetical protein L600_000900000330 [Isoptericola variabilis J7]|nr:hypothetical protein L600_000900000330 [Isoptericola variabilis J7]
MRLMSTDLEPAEAPEDFPGTSADTGWYVTPEAQTVREVYRGLEAEFGTVDYFVDLHNQWSCYATEDLESMSPLSISARFIDDPSEFGDWPKFDMDASKRANVAVYKALQNQGRSGFGAVTLYPQDTNLPGTALGSFALRGSATVLFETSSQTQYDGMKRNGMLRAAGSPARTRAATPPKPPRRTMAPGTHEVPTEGARHGGDPLDHGPSRRGRPPHDHPRHEPPPHDPRDDPARRVGRRRPADHRPGRPAQARQRRAARARRHAGDPQAVARR